MNIFDRPTIKELLDAIIDSLDEEINSEKKPTINVSKLLPITTYTIEISEITEPEPLP